MGLETTPSAVIRNSQNVEKFAGSVRLETMNENIKIQRKKTSKRDRKTDTYIHILINIHTYIY